MVVKLFVQSAESTPASCRTLVTHSNLIFTLVMVFSLSLNLVSGTCPPTSDEELHDLLMRQHPIASHESSWTIPSWQSYIQHHLNQSSGEPEPVSGYDLNCSDSLHEVPEARTHERWVKAVWTAGWGVLSLTCAYKLLYPYYVNRINIVLFIKEWALLPPKNFLNHSDGPGRRFIYF